MRPEPAARHVLILLLPGFDAGFVMECVRLLREAGIEVTLVGSSKQDVRSRFGVAVRPDKTLNEVRVQSARTVLLIPDAEEGAALLTDPRVHELVRHTIMLGGVIMAAEAVSPHLLRTDGLATLRTAKNFVVSQFALPEDTFTQLVNHVPAS